MFIPHLLLQVVAPCLLLPCVIPHLLCYSTLLLPSSTSLFPTCYSTSLLPTPRLLLHILTPYSPLVIPHSYSSLVVPHPYSLLLACYSTFLLPTPRLLFLPFKKNTFGPPCIPTPHDCSPFACCCSLLIFPRMVLPPPLFHLQVVFGATTNK